MWKSKEGKKILLDDYISHKLSIFEQIAEAACMCEIFFFF